MATDSRKSVLRGILFFVLCPLLIVGGGLIWSDFFVLDTGEHPAPWIYVVGPVITIAGALIFIGFIIWGKSKERASR